MIAFFDLDGTITKKDTFIEFIKFVRGNLFFFLGLVVLSPKIISYFLRIYPNYKLKELFFSFYLKKFNEKELLKLGNEFGKLRMPLLVNEAAIERIKWHLLKNHQVVILTASSPIWLSYWCENLSIQLIGTIFETVNGRYTGKIEGKNCHGNEKKRIVKKILLQKTYSKTYGYGNSKSDLPFLVKLNDYYFGEIKSIELLPTMYKRH